MCFPPRLCNIFSCYYVKGKWVIYTCLLKKAGGSRDKNPQPPKRKKGIKPFTHLDIISHTQLKHYDFIYYLFIIFLLSFYGNFNDLPWVYFTKVGFGVCVCVIWSEAKDRDIIYCSFESCNPHYGWSIEKERIKKYEKSKRKQLLRPFFFINVKKEE